jgi:hypothetical protein
MADERGRWPDVHVGVSIGVRNHAVESVLEGIMAEKWAPRGWKPGDHTTIQRPIGSLMPRKRWKRWCFREGRDHLTTFGDLTESVKNYGMPFIEAHASLPRIAEALTDMERIDLSRLAYNAPVAYYLLGDSAKAEEILNQELEKRDAWVRQNPGGGDDPDYRYFVAELSRRLERIP